MKSSVELKELTSKGSVKDNALFYYAITKIFIQEEIEMIQKALYEDPRD